MCRSPCLDIVGAADAVSGIRSTMQKGTTMRSRRALGALALAAVLALGGCASGEGGETESEPAAASEPTSEPASEPASEPMATETMTEPMATETATP